MAQTIIPNGSETDLANLKTLGDIAVDTTNNGIRFGDGVTQGGRLIPDAAGVKSSVDAAAASAALANNAARTFTGTSGVSRLAFLAASAAGGALLSAFRSDQAQGMDLFVTFDGTTLSRINSETVYDGIGRTTPSVVPATGFRDPYITPDRFADGYFYAFGSKGFNFAQIIIARSLDLATWLDVGELSFVTSSTPNVQLAYAPRGFIHPTTGAFYLEVALSNNSDPSQQTFAMTYRKLKATNPTASGADWDDPIAYGEGFNYIDGATYFDAANSMFRRFQKNETTKFIERFDSATYPNPGNWTKGGAGDWAGWGANLEAPRIVRIGTKLVIYLDPYNGFQYYASTADSFTGPWSAKTLIDTGGPSIRHCNPIALDSLTRRRTVATAIDAIARVELSGVVYDRASYVDGGGARRAQSVSGEGNPLNMAWMHFRSNSDYAVSQNRRQDAPGTGWDIVYRVGNSYGSIETVVNFSVKEALKWDLSTGRVDIPMGLLPRAFVTVPLLNGWANATIPVRYRKERDGSVFLVGNVSNSGTPAFGSVVATLPAEARPAATTVRTCNQADVNSAQMVVEANTGNIVYLAGTPTKIDLSGLGPFLAADAIT